MPALLRMRASGFAERVEHPNCAESRVYHKQAAVVTYRHTVRSPQAARKLLEHARLAHPIPEQRKAQHLQRAADTDVQHFLCRIEHEAVRIRQPVHQHVERAVRPSAEHAPVQVLEAAFAGIGEVKVTVVGEYEVVEAAETVGQQRARARYRIESQQAELVIGDVDLPVAMDLEPVRIAVVLGEHLPCSVVGDDGRYVRARRRRNGAALRGRTPALRGTNAAVLRRVRASKPSACPQSAVRPASG